MGAFEYTALDAGGREKKGVLEGDTARSVRQQLRDKQLTPLTVEEVAQREQVRGRKPGFSQGMSAADLALLTRQLSTLIGSGLPLEEALRTVAQQTEKPRLTSMILGVRARVVEGHALAQAMAEFPHAFPEMYRATVAAGEQSGRLDLVLDRLADYTESRQALRQKIQVALFYPIILTVLALSVATLLMVYVVPQVVGVFEGIGQELPWLTRALIEVSDFLQHYGLLLLLGIVLLAVAGFLMLKRPGPKQGFHRFVLRLPLVGRLVRGINAARFARTLSILSASGVTVLEALRIAGEVMSNIPMREAVASAARKVREGSSIRAALEQSGYFPPMTLNLITSGEASGNLEAMLERAAINQEREIETTVQTLMGMLEPLMIVLMGLMVLVIVMAILLQIFDLNQLVH